MTADVPGVATPPRLPPVAMLVLRVFTLIGAVLLVAAAVLVAKEAAFLTRSERATATVSRIETAWMGTTDRYGRTNSTGGGTGYRVIATFRAPDGQNIEVRSPSLTSATSYRVGDPIDVNYPPQHPEQARLARFVDQWMLPIVLGAIGGVALGICALAMWLVRQPGTRVTSNGMGGFRISSGAVIEAGRDDSAPSAASSDRPAPAAASARWPRRSFSGLWLGVVLVLGIGIGVIASHRRASRDGNTVVVAPVSQAAKPAPGYPPDLRVDPPAMTDPQSPPRTTAELIAAARVFVARPTQDVAMQAELRRKVARLGLDCPGIVFTPGETLLLGTPPPVIDAGGTMTRGLIRQRFTAVNCPGRSPEYNIWVFAAGDGTSVRTVAGYPGTTRTDLFLLRDATPIVLGIAARLAPGCTDLNVSDTHFDAASTPAPGAPWIEQWLVTGCGKSIALTVNFMPDATRGMTRIEVPSEEARLLPAI